MTASTWRLGTHPTFACCCHGELAGQGKPPSKAQLGTMDSPHNEYFPFASSALTGLVVCLAIVIATGSNEAWDSPVYFTVGIPLMCLSVFTISYLFPERAWRWTVTMAVGQFAAALLGGSSLSLWPLALISMTILSLPQLITGFIASGVARRRDRA